MERGVDLASLTKDTGEVITCLKKVKDYNNTWGWYTSSYLLSNLINQSYGTQTGEGGGVFISRNSGTCSSYYINARALS